MGLRIGPIWGLSADGNITPQRREKEEERHRSTLLCAKFVKIVWQEIGEIVRYLPDKKIKISAPSQTVAIERIAPNVRQGQPPTFVSQRSKLHPNRFTFGRVITGRVKAVLWAHWVNPILARSDASLRVNNNTFSSRLRIWRRLEPDFGKNFLS